jgi:hypothetical protein
MNRVQKGLVLLVVILGCAVTSVAGLALRDGYSMPILPPQLAHQMWLGVGVLGVVLVALSVFFFFREVVANRFPSRDRREFEEAYREWERQQSPVPFPIWYNTADKTVAE